MFRSFLSKFSPEGPAIKAGDIDGYIDDIEGGREFFVEYSGVAFNSGLYRIHTVDSAKKWNSIVGEAYPKFKNRIMCFSYDWLGRQFALDRERRNEEGEPLVLMMELGTGEALEIPATFLSFHNEELVDYTDAALAENFYYKWLNSAGRNLSPNECVGYKIPLFLGGEDIISNLEIIDIEVYWGICGQLLNKVKSLPPGTTIKDITINN
jgi:hypothetical protein